MAYVFCAVTLTLFSVAQTIVVKPPLVRRGAPNKGGRFQLPGGGLTTISYVRGTQNRKKSARFARRNLHLPKVFQWVPSKQGTRNHQKPARFARRLTGSMLRVAPKQGGVNYGEGG